MKREIIFLEDKKAVDYQSGERKDKSIILSEIRKLKADKKIKTFNKTEGITGTKFEIKLKDNSIINIAVSKEDKHSIVVLNTIMQSKKVYQDEAVMTFDGKKVIISSRESGIIQGERDQAQIMSLLKAMYNNGEISTVIKSGRKNYTYSIETKDNERLKIYVNMLDPIADELDAFTNVVVRKNKIKKAIRTGVIAAGTFVVVVTTPYTKGVITTTYQNAKTSVETYIREQEQDKYMMDKWPYLESCALRLKADNITKDDFIDFMTELGKMIQHYETTKTKEELEKSRDYKRLKEWSSLVDENYSTIMNRRVY